MIAVLPVPHSGVPLASGVILKPEPMPRVRFDPGVEDCQMFTGMFGLSVICSRDRSEHGALLHVSCAYPEHLPTWDTVKHVRNAFFPDDVDVAMILPRKEDYVNLHPYTFHLWQIPVEWGLR